LRASLSAFSVSAFPIPLPRCFFEIKTVSMNSDPYEVWSVNMTTILLPSRNVIASGR